MVQYPEPEWIDPCSQFWDILMLYYHVGIYNIVMPNSSPDLYHYHVIRVNVLSQVYKGGKTCRNTTHTHMLLSERCPQCGAPYKVGPPSYNLSYNVHKLTYKQG